MYDTIDLIELIRKSLKLKPVPYIESSIFPVNIL